MKIFGAPFYKKAQNNKSPQHQAKRGKSGEIRLIMPVRAVVVIADSPVGERKSGSFRRVIAMSGAHLGTCVGILGKPIFISRVVCAGFKLQAGAENDCFAIDFGQECFVGACRHFSFFVALSVFCVV